MTQRARSEVLDLARSFERLEQALQERAGALELLEAVTARFERLALVGTHADLEGNGLAAD